MTTQAACYFFLDRAQFLMVSRTVFLFHIHGTQKSCTSGVQSQVVKGHPLCGLHLPADLVWGHTALTQDQGSGQLGPRAGVDKQQQGAPDGRCWALHLLLTRVPISSPLQQREGGRALDRDQP